MFAQFTVLTQRILWTALLVFFAWAILFAVLMGLVLFRLYHPMPTDLGVCGEVVAHSTRLILSMGLPLAASASLGLLILSRSGVGAIRPVVVALTATMICVLALIGFRLWLEMAMPGTDMSVWWMLK
jgi:hypothetical protein